MVKVITDSLILLKCSNFKLRFLKEKCELANGKQMKKKRKNLNWHVRAEDVLKTESLNF